MMRQRQGIRFNRKAIGATVIAGVLVAGGITGVQHASAGENAAKVGDVVVVDGQQFNIADCDELEINGGTVICDGEELAPEEELGAGEEANAAAAALETACDEFAADQAAAAEEEAGAEEE